MAIRPTLTVATHFVSGFNLSLTYFYFLTSNWNLNYLRVFVLEYNHESIDRQTAMCFDLVISFDL